jgi:hypothetical protein
MVLRVCPTYCTCPASDAINDVVCLAMDVCLCFVILRMTVTRESTDTKMRMVETKKT